MKPKSELFNGLINNINILDYAYKILAYRNNSRVRNIVCKLQTIDPIMNYEKFREEMLKFPVNATELRMKYVSAESELYGHFNAIVKYSNLGKVNVRGILVEHGVNFSVSNFNKIFLDSNAIIICQSDYKRALVHHCIPNKPVFSIGPYVYYAEDYYSEEEYKHVKERFGKCVLVYTNHTWELSELDRNYHKHYEKIIKRYENDYDKILFCVYWHDVNDKLYDLLAQHPKVQLVSAGFRVDPLFMNRTKSLINISDRVAVTGIGTCVGYAICLGKKVDYIDCSDECVVTTMNDLELKRDSENKDGVISALVNGNENEVAEAYNKFWGGANIKTQKEMKEILLGASEIIEKSCGKKTDFLAVSRRLLKRWEVEKPERYKLFNEAMYDL